MSLDFHLYGIQNYQELCFKKLEDGGGITDFVRSLVWSSMAVGIGTLTEKNIDEWEFRLAVKYLKSQSTFACKAYGQHLQHMPTREELEKYIGLKTNVLTVSREEWMSTQFMYAVTDARTDFKRKVDVAKIISEVNEEKSS